MNAKEDTAHEECVKYRHELYVKKHHRSKHDNKPKEMMRGRFVKAGIHTKHLKWGLRSIKEEELVG